MNVRNRRGIENLLLRRVRRHQAMTALFRAPGTDSERPRAAQARPVVQKQEQDTPVEAPVAEAASSPVVAPTRSNVVARKVEPSSRPIPAPLPLLPSTPVSEPAKTPDPVWKRLQTIFRKHEKHSDSDAADTTNMEASAAEAIQPRAREEKETSQTIATDERVLPAQNPTAAIPSASAVQRSAENVEQKSGPASPSMQRKGQPISSTEPETMLTAEARAVESKPALPGKMTELNDQVSAEPETPSLPLESVWNVQRLEAQHPLFRENMGSTNVDTNKTSIETSPVHEQKPTVGPVQLQREDDSPTGTQISDPLPLSEQREELHGPVETLSPSRPRPPQINLPSKNVQRQIQENHASKEISETPPVNTAIGPLPADLWWLLGQKPPAAAPAVATASQSQPEIQRTIQRDPEQAPVEQSYVSHPHLPAEQPAETSITPNTIQRQTISKDPLPSTGQEPAKPARPEETGPAEPDLDDLARRVYAEVRRRLAAEWERRR